MVLRLTLASTPAQHHGNKLLNDYYNIMYVIMAPKQSHVKFMCKATHVHVSHLMLELTHSVTRSLDLFQKHPNVLKIIVEVNFPL